MANASRVLVLAVVVLSGCGGHDSKSNNARLEELSISSGTLDPVFSAGQLTYSATVDAATASITISANTEHPKATVSVNGGGASRGQTAADVSLQQGDNQIGVVVTAENGKTASTYSISLFRPALSYSIGGSVNGLTGSLTLQNNGADDLSLSADGTFAFATALADGSNYDVSVSSQPIGQQCALTNGSGTIAGADVTDISVDCGGPAATYFVAGSVTGLIGEVVLQVNGTRDLLVTKDGFFNFADPFVDNASFDITIRTQPTAQTCTITNGSGTIAGAHAVDTEVDCSGAGVVSGSVFDWEWINPLPQGNQIIDFASSGSLLVGITDAGTAQTSSDGLNWTTQDTGIEDYLHAIAWGGGQFVAVSDYGSIATSSDGATWQVQNLGRYRYLSDVTWNGSMFLAVGYERDIGTGIQNSIAATSPDGQTWSVHQIGWQSPTDVRGLAWNGSLFVATQYPGDVHTSPDGINWTTTQVDLSGDAFQDVASDGARFVALSFQGAVYSSLDGVSWTLEASGVLLGAIGIEWNGSRFQTVALNKLLTSPDGATWTESIVDASPTTILFTTASFAGLTVVAGGYGAIHTSPDDVTWTPQQTRDPTGWRSVIWDGGQFLTVGDEQTIRTSPDGSAWTMRHTQPATNSLSGLARGGSQYVAVGYGTGGVILTSPDAITWSTQATSLVGNVSLRNVAWGDSQFVAVGDDGTILTSPDGIAWTTQTSGIDNTDQLMDIAWNGSIWVAAGHSSTSDSNGIFVTSPDGVTWTRQLMPRWLQPVAIVWNGSQFVAVGGSGIARSSDGLNWSRLQTSLTFMQDVTWTGSQFVVVGFDAQVLTSPDALTWSAKRSASKLLVSVASDDSRAVVVGVDGRILINDHL